LSRTSLFHRTSLIRVAFDKVHIIRILDEMPLSTEAETKNEGLVPNHLAYRVEGSMFRETQSEAFKKTKGKWAQHYRFVTGWTCLDVISDSPPAMSVVSSGDVTPSSHETP